MNSIILVPLVINIQVSVVIDDDADNDVDVVVIVDDDENCEIIHEPSLYTLWLLFLTKTERNCRKRIRICIIHMQQQQQQQRAIQMNERKF